MLVILLIILGILWFLNYIGAPIIPLSTVIFTLFSVSVTLYQFLVFLIILAFTGLLPSPFRLVAVFLLFLWILSLFGLVSIFNLQDIIIFAVVFGVIYSLFGGSL